MDSFGEVLTAMVTPFNEKLELDLKRPGNWLLIW